MASPRLSARSGLGLAAFAGHLAGLITAGCKPPVGPATQPAAAPPMEDAPAAPPLFADLTATSGISFTYRNGEDTANHLSILESLGGGVGLIDYDGDGQRLLRRAIELAPRDHEVHYQLGRCLERQGKSEEAQEAREHFDQFKQVEADLVRLDSYLKAVVNNPRDPAPRREAGMICLRNGQPAEGLRWLQGALEIAPDDKAAHAALAEYYSGQGDLKMSSYTDSRPGDKVHCARPAPHRHCQRSIDGIVVGFLTSPPSPAETRRS